MDHSDPGSAQAAAEQQKQLSDLQTKVDELEVKNSELETTNGNLLDAIKGLGTTLTADQKSFFRRAFYVQDTTGAEKLPDDLKDIEDDWEWSSYKRPGFDIPSVIYLVLAILGVWAARWAFYAEGKQSLSKALIVVLVIAVFSILVEAGNRYQTYGKRWKFELPLRAWSIPLPFLFLFIAVYSYANIYSGEEAEVIRNVNDTIEKVTSENELLYFSVATITTVGYGDLRPNNDYTRDYVIREVFTGLAILICTLPLVISRVGQF